MKPENRFIHAIHKLLPREVYAEKTYNTLRGGTPDCYYEGNAGTFWVEYKWLPKTPLQAFTPKLSKLQIKWLIRNYENGRDPWVIVGSPLHSFILQHPRSWTSQVELLALARYSREEIAEQIAKRVLR